MTQQITELADLHLTTETWRKAGESIALVPTMGALHEGHISLVTLAKRQAKRVVVSIFVNPTQFGPKEDFSRYPRTLEGDLALLKEASADAVWVPTVEEIYPEGAHSSVHVEGIGDMLEGSFRPGHFDGVATVVKRLLEQVNPDIAIFGEKDYQQLCLIKRLVNDFNIDVSIVAAPTMREPDGLALSSRNRYLSAEERAKAPLLHHMMEKAAARIQRGEPVEAVQEEAKLVLAKGGFRVDYLELRQEDTLKEVPKFKPPARLLAAVWLGTTRLIDNMRVA